MTTLTDFLLARIAEDEALAREAVDPKRPGTHWQWVRTSDDTPVEDPASDPTDQFTYGLRTVEKFPTVSGVGVLPAFVTAGLFPSESRGHRHIARHDPARVLAECEAKRRIVGRCDLVANSWDAVTVGNIDVTGAPFPDVRRRERSHAYRTMIDLALPYADHADYREEWRP